MRGTFHWQRWSRPNKITAIVAVIAFVVIALLTVLMLVTAGDAPKDRLETLVRGAFEIEFLVIVVTLTATHLIAAAIRAGAWLVRAASSSFGGKARIAITG